MGPDFYEVEKIRSGFLAVMAKPLAGEWIDDEFAGLATVNIHQVVSLLEATEAYEVGLADEAAACDRHGIKFVSYPIPDRGLPKSVVGYAAFTRSLYNEIAGGLSTVVHCRAGIGRTGVIAAGILLHAGFEPQDAFAHISKARGIEVPDTSEQRDWVVRNYDEITRDNLLNR